MKYSQKCNDLFKIYAILAIIISLGEVIICHAKNVRNVGLITSKNVRAKRIIKKIIARRKVLL